jgi:hypothetical protein
VEVQILQCIADNGSFKLGFRQEVTEEIPFDAVAAVIETELEKLSTLSDLTVTIYDSLTACSTTGNVTIQVSFATTHGDLPPLKVFTELLIDDTNSNGNLGTGVINVATDGEAFGYHVSIKGTTENAYCNNRGLPPSPLLPDPPPRDLRFQDRHLSLLPELGEQQWPWRGGQEGRLWVSEPSEHQRRQDPSQPRRRLPALHQVRHSRGGEAGREGAGLVITEVLYSA